MSQFLEVILIYWNVLYRSPSPDIGFFSKHSNSPVRTKLKSLLSYVDRLIF